MDTYLTRHQVTTIIHKYFYDHGSNVRCSIYDYDNDNWFEGILVKHDTSIDEHIANEIPDQPLDDA